MEGTLQVVREEPQQKKSDAGKTSVTVTYRVAGNPEAQLASIAEPVDRVLGEQVSRLARFVERGRPG